MCYVIRAPILRQEESGNGGGEGVVQRCDLVFEVVEEGEGGEEEGEAPEGGGDGEGEVDGEKDGGAEGEAEEE